MRWDPITRMPLYDCPVCLDEGWESRTYQQDGFYRARPCECKRGIAIAAGRWRGILKRQDGAGLLNRLKSERPAYAQKLMAYLGEHPEPSTDRSPD